MSARSRNREPLMLEIIEIKQLLDDNYLIGLQALLSSWSDRICSDYFVEIC